MAKFTKVAALKDIQTINPLGILNKTVEKVLPSSETEYFSLGDAVTFNPDLSSFDFKENSSTGELNEEAIQSIKADIGKKGIVTKIVETENGTDWGKPSELEVTLEDGRKLYYPAAFFNVNK